MGRGVIGEDGVLLESIAEYFAQFLDGEAVVFCHAGQILFLCKGF
jgi:hypothetical protein